MKRAISLFSVFGLTSVVIVNLQMPANAISACGRPSGVGYECYEDGVVNARTDYGRTLQFSGQIQAGSGYVITRVEFINQAQFGSVNGPNIKKIQSGSSVTIADILSETSRQLEEAYNKAQGEYKNVKYMAEVKSRTLNEIVSRREVLSRVSSNVDVVTWDGSVSGRCVTRLFGGCVDSTGGKLSGLVRVYKLYIGSISDARTFNQSVQTSIQQALALTQQENATSGSQTKAPTPFSLELCDKKIQLRSWKGDYLHRPDSNQGVTTWHTGSGNVWRVDCINQNQIKLQSWKGDFLHRPDSNQGVTTWHTGSGNVWNVKNTSNGEIQLRSWKGDYLHRPDSNQGVTTWDSGQGNVWVIEPIP